MVTAYINLFIYSFCVVGFMIFTEAMTDKEIENDVVADKLMDIHSVLEDWPAKCFVSTLKKCKLDILILDGESIIKCMQVKKENDENCKAPSPSVSSTIKPRENSNESQVSKVNFTFSLEEKNFDSIHENNTTDFKKLPESSLINKTKITPDLTTISLINEKTLENSNKKIDEELNSIGETTISSAYEVTASSSIKTESEKPTFYNSEKNSNEFRTNPQSKNLDRVEGTNSDLINENDSVEFTTLTNTKTNWNEETNFSFNEKNSNKKGPISKDVNSDQETKYFLSIRDSETSSAEITTVLTTIQD